MNEPSILHADHVLEELVAHINFAQSKLKEMDDALLASCICAKDKFRHTTPAWIEEQISIIYHEFKQKNVNLDIYLQEIKESIKEVREGEVNGQSDNN